MATRIDVGHMYSDGPVSYLVTEDFDTVLERVAPINPPTSHLEHRGAFIFTGHNTGGRVFVNSQPIAVIEDAEDE